MAATVLLGAAVGRAYAAKLPLCRVRYRAVAVPDLARGAGVDLGAVGHQLDGAGRVVAVLRGCRCAVSTIPPPALLQRRRLRVGTADVAGLEQHAAHVVEPLLGGVLGTLGRRYLHVPERVFVERHVFSICAVVRHGRRWRRWRRRRQRRLVAHGLQLGRLLAVVGVGGLGQLGVVELVRHRGPIGLGLVHDVATLAAGVFVP